jgi:cytolysin (calcineurin-like family phosphatase)
MLIDRFTFNPRPALGALAVLLGLHAANISAPAQQRPDTDVTFVFMADPHVSFNGYNDYEWYYSYYIDVTPLRDPLTISWAENMVNKEAGGNGCLAPGQGDLCNQIQVVRKMEALTNPLNQWPGTGLPIGPVSGVVVGGDMTDCGGGGSAPSPNYNGYNHCSDYNSDLNGAQLAAFIRVFDHGHQLSPPIYFTPMPFLWGLTNPDGSVPLKYDLFPGFGNHDLNFVDSAQVRDYVGQWKTGAKIGPTTILYSDPGSQSYSWNWGGVHLVNVGVFAGSDSNDYNFSIFALDWLKNDLSAYASDGRPVIIFQHFGFDPQWGISWYPKAGLQSLFDTIKNYNVVGIFTGHNHGALHNYQYPSLTWQDANGNWQPTDSTGTWHPIPNSIWPDWQSSVPKSQKVSSLPLTAYDIFHPGAAFSQRFALVHVTNNRMDVTYSDGSDFNQASQKINFTNSYTKHLAPPPFESSLPVPGVTLGQARTVVNPNYLVTTLAGQFTVAEFSSGGAERVTDQENAIALGLPVSFALRPLQLTSEQGALLASDGQTLAYLTINAGKLHLDWTAPQPIHTDSITALTLNKTGYLLAYRTSDARAIFSKIGNQSGQHLTTVLNTQMDQIKDPVLHAAIVGFITAQFIPYPENQTESESGEPARFLRYDPVNGYMEHLAFNVRNGVATLNPPVLDTTWAPRASLIQPFRDSRNFTEFLVVSNACQKGTLSTVLPNGSFGIPTYCSPESPIMIRKLLTDQASTQVSWRGNPESMVASEALTGGQPAIGAAAPVAYDAAGGTVLGVAAEGYSYNITVPIK